MASPKKSSKTVPTQSHPLPRLYLVTPPVSDVAAMAAQLPQLVRSFDIAAVLLRLEPADERGMISCVKGIAPLVQQAGAALLVDRHYGIVARGGADGVHVGGLEAMEEAAPSMKPDRIVGVGALHTRHDAMVAGESGADYVLFGEPDAQGVRPSTDAIVERLQWWAELFEPPCVGYAAALDETALFAATGAEFIMAADFVWNDARGPAGALDSAVTAIRQGHAQAFTTVTAAGQD